MTQKYQKLSTLMLSLFLTVLYVNGQQEKSKNYDAQMPPWFIGLDLYVGYQSNTLQQYDWAASYLNALNANIDPLSINRSLHGAAGLSAGYFFGQKRNFGLGTGIQYVRLMGDLSLNPMSIEYQSTDANGHIFRQIIRSNEQIEERINQNIVGLPLMVMFKKQITNRWGINLDAGVVFNFYTSGKYNSDNAIFDYEAIYKFGGDGNPIYDASSTPHPNSWLITAEHYQRTNPNGDVNTYFENLQTQGYNVGLGINTTNTAGAIENLTVNTSWFVRPSISYRIHPQWAIHGNFMFQQVKTSFDNAPNSYRITDRRGDYQSMTKGMINNSQNLFSFGLGVRYYFGKTKKVEPIAEEETVVVLPVEEKELPQDEVSKSDSVMFALQLIDKNSNMPLAGNITITKQNQDVKQMNTDASGLKQLVLDPGEYRVRVEAKGYFTAEEKVQINEDQLEEGMTLKINLIKIEKGMQLHIEAINFATASYSLSNEAKSILDQVIKVLKLNPDILVEISGHTDYIGNENYNLLLSKNRSNAVMQYLIDHGVSKNQLKPIGYGKKNPKYSNENEEGRFRNRRVNIVVIEIM